MEISVFCHANLWEKCPDALEMPRQTYWASASVLLANKDPSFIWNIQA